MSYRDNAASVAEADAECVALEAKCAVAEVDALAAREAAREAKDEAQRYLGERDEALADVEALEQRVADAHDELDKQGAPPGPLLHARVRDLVRSLRGEAATAREILIARKSLAAALAAAPDAAATVISGVESVLNVEAAGLWGARRRLPKEHRSITHHACIAGHDVYITVGLFDDGTPGALFFRIAKQGSTIAGLLDNLGIAVSFALQYGVPLEKLCEKYIGQAFEPSGPTLNPEIPVARSLSDYTFRYLDKKFLGGRVAAAIASRPALIALGGRP